MADIVGSRTLRSQWDETVRYYGSSLFLEYISSDDRVSRYTYEEFDVLVHEAANFFLDLGIRPGEMVSLHMHNRPEYLICWLALAQIGAVSVPLNEHYRLPESEYVLHKCGITKVITETRSASIYTENAKRLGLTAVVVADIAENTPEALSLPAGMAAQPYALKENRPVHSGDHAVILFTSGTTSRPKGAVYTHRNVVYGGLLHIAQMGMSHGDRFLSSMPAYHMDFQEMAAMPCICSGSTVVMVEHFSARRFWRQVCEHKANFTDTMSIMNRTMLMQPVAPWEKDHCLKQIYFSMGLSDEEKDAFEQRFGVSLLNSYGMTETVTGVTCAPLTGEKRWPSVGRPALSYHIKITDEEGREVPAGTVGEICVHGVPGETLVPYYYEDPEATRSLYPEENWLHSGDRGYLDEDGFLYFVDRKQNMIKRAGENVGSLEVELVLTSHPEVADSAVIGVPAPIRDQAVMAFVQRMEGSKLTAEELTEYCSDRLSRFKVPTIWQFVEDFPRTSTGKIRKKALADMYEQSREA